MIAIPDSFTIPIARLDSDFSCLSCAFERREAIEVPLLLQLYAPGKNGGSVAIEREAAARVCQNSNNILAKGCVAKTH
jgi:hypothetical protein